MAYILKHTAEEIDHKLDLVDENKNLLPYPYRTAFPEGLTDIGDGSILTTNRNGAYSESRFLLNDCILPAGKEYIVSLSITDILEVPTEISGFAIEVAITGQSTITITNQGKIDLRAKSEGTTASISLIIPSIFTNNLLIKPQIEEGSGSATTWVPYMKTVGSYVDQRFSSTNAKIKTLIDNIADVNQDISNLQFLDTNIKLEADIWTDKTIGYIEGTSTSPKKVANAGDTLKTMFTNIFGTVEDDDTDLVTNPSITRVSLGSSSYEYGTKLTSLPVTISVASGSYKYGPDVDGAGWTGNFKLSGTGFTTKEDSTSTSQTISLSSQFTVGTSSSLSLSVSRSYASATNTAVSKLGAATTQKIDGDTAGKSATFNPTAVKYVYYAVTSNTTTPTTWTKYGSGQTSTTDLSITADAGKYVWIAAASNYTNIYTYNEVSGKYNTDATATTKLSNQTIKNSQSASASGYYIYRITNAKALGGTVKYKLG